MATKRRAEAAQRALQVAEPRAAYGQRPPAVVDASLIAALLFAEPELPSAAMSRSLLNRGAVAAP